MTPAAAASPSDPGDAPAGEAQDFLQDAQAFYAAVACGAQGVVPEPLDRSVIDKHCAEMTKRYERFRARYVVPASAFFATARPELLPERVVYPFGGGDLVSALVTFPSATEITTVSLEHAGDPTRLRELERSSLRTSLSEFRAAVYGLFTNNDSTSENMRKLERGGIPGQLSFHLSGAAALGYAPVSLKFFTIEDSGALHYLTAQEITALAPVQAKRKKGTWVDTDFSAAFTNMELTLRKLDDPAAPPVVHRHVAANLANNGFRGSGLEKYLLARGSVAAMTKAASY
jgi:hypothetical protein